MMTILADFIFWAWIVFAVLDSVAGVLGWLELRNQHDATLRRLSKVMYGGGQRSIITIIGLLLFGLNIKAHPLYLIAGLWGVAYKAYATWGWLLYYRGVINGGGWWALVKRKK